MTYFQEYYKRNRERILKRVNDYYSKHSKEMNKYAREYYRNNKPKILIQERARQKAKKLKLVPSKT